MICICLSLSAIPLGIIVVDNDSDLEQVRQHIIHLVEDIGSSGGPVSSLSDKWCFVDCKY